MSIPTYKTNRTGAQVSDALQQMNERIPEGWAVGAADGVPVSSGSPFWHNNAKYYAEQAGADAAQTAVDAQESAANAQSALESKEAAEESADSAEASAQRAEAIVGGHFVSYGEDQGLSDAHQEQARKNIRAANSNPNLIKNGFFRLNGRAQSSYNGNGQHTLDCWGIRGTDPSVTLLSGGGVQVVGSGDGQFYQDQALGFQAPETGKTYTFSVLVTELTGTCRAVWHAGTYFDLSVGLNTYTGVAASEMKAVYACINLNGTIKIKAVKLEVGTVSTLLNDVAFDDNLEAIRCNYPMFSNRNLLDNPWFGSGEVVNQRGGTSGTVSNAYFIDRWKLSGEYSIATSGITFTCNAGAGVSQIFPHALTIGEIYTFSVMYGDGSIVSCTFAPLANRENAYPFSDGLYLEIDTRAAFPTHRCIIYTPGTSWTKEIKAVKLELGSVSTLANDAPPDYGEELAKCQRYFVRIASTATAFPVAFGLKDSSTVVDLLVPTPVEMRARPTTTFSGTHRIWGGGVASRDVASYSTVAKNAIGVYLRATIASGSLPDYYNYVLYMNNGAYIDFSADL